MKRVCPSCSKVLNHQCDFCNSLNVTESRLMAGQGVCGNCRTVFPWEKASTLASIVCDTCKRLRKAKNP
jgi:hypothetical protein